MTEEFWGLEVRADKLEIVDVPSGYVLRFTNVALDVDVSAEPCSCALYVKTHGIQNKKLVSTLYSNRPGRNELIEDLKLDSKVDIVFGPETQIEFSTTKFSSIAWSQRCILSLTGYLEPRPMHEPKNASLQANESVATAFYSLILLSILAGLFFYASKSRRLPYRPMVRDG
jgi:hypothetical protein